MKMLAQSSTSIRQLAPIDSGIDLTNRAFQQAWLNLANDLRLSDIDMNQFENTTAALVYVILNGRGIHRQAIARHISLEKCIGCPSIISIVNSGYLDQGKIIKLIVALIADVASFFDVKTNESIEEMTWYVYEYYGHLSLEDLILFTQNCKDRKFTTKYQHIAAKGVNPEFFQLWLREYDLQRQEVNKQISQQFRSFSFSQNEPTPTFWEDAAASLAKVELLRKKRDSKLRELRLSENARKRAFTAQQVLTDFFASEIYCFQIKHCNKSTKELAKIAAERSRILIKVWTQELERNDLDKPAEQEQQPDFLEKYLMIKVKALTLKSIKQKRKISAVQIIQNGINQLVQHKNIQHGYQLIAAVYDVDRQEGTESLLSVKSRLTTKLHKMMVEDYKNYATKMINEEVPFIEKEKYYQRWAWGWISKRCLSKIENAKNILIEETFESTPKQL